MRAVVQRVTSARVTVNGSVVSEIGAGLCVFVGVSKDDTDRDAGALADKVVGLRIFPDDQGKMNLGLEQTRGQLLAVSQFTLLGDVRKGKRPSFGQAMEPEGAKHLFELFCKAARARGVSVKTGVFRAHMLVGLENEGPVTILLDTTRAF